MVGKRSAFLPIHQIIYWLIFVFVGVLIYPESAVAQKDMDLPTYELEEITVIGESLGSLERRVYQAEDIMFEIFNSLNSTDDFDIKCKYIAFTHLNSKIKRRVCDIGYIEKARALDAYLYMTMGFPFRSDYQLTMAFDHKTEALIKELSELAAKHTSLAKALVNDIALNQLYITEQRERFRDSILVRRPKPEEYFGDELKFLNMAYSAHKNGILDEELWNYWDRRIRSVIHQEPYRSIWLSSSNNKYTMKFIGYVTAIIWDNTVGFSAE